MISKNVLRFLVDTNDTFIKKNSLSHVQKEIKKRELICIGVFVQNHVLKLERDLLVILSKYKKIINSI